MPAAASSSTTLGNLYNSAAAKKVKDVEVMEVDRPALSPPKKVADIQPKGKPSKSQEYRPSSQQYNRMDFGTPSYPSPLDRIRTGRRERAVQLGVNSNSVEDSFLGNQSFPKITKPNTKSSELYQSPSPALKLKDFKGDGLNDVSFTAGHSKGTFEGDMSMSIDQSLNASLNESWSFYKFIGGGQTGMKFPSTVRNPNKAICTINSKTSEILIANEMACELFGYETTELIGMKLIDLIKLKPKEQETILESHLEPSGEVINISGKVVDAEDSNGLILPISLWVKHLAMRKEPRCLVVMEPVERTVAEVSFNEEGSILSCDDNMAYLHGYSTSDDLHGVKVKQLIPSLKLPQPGTEISSDIRKQRATGRAVDGSTFPLSISVKVSKSESGDSPGRVKTVYKGIVWVFANISGMITFLPDGTIHSINENFAATMFGFTPSDLIGKPITTLIPDFYDILELNDDPMPLPPEADCGHIEDSPRLCSESNDVKSSLTDKKFVDSNKDTPFKVGGKHLQFDGLMTSTPNKSEGVDDLLRQTSKRQLSCEHQNGSPRFADTAKDDIPCVDDRSPGSVSSTSSTNTTSSVKENLSLTSNQKNEDKLKMNSIRENSDSSVQSCDSKLHDSSLHSENDIDVSKLDNTQDSLVDSVPIGKLNLSDDSSNSSFLNQSGASVDISSQGIHADISNAIESSSGVKDLFFDDSHNNTSTTSPKIPKTHVPRRVVNDSIESTTSSEDDVFKNIEESLKSAERMDNLYKANQKKSSQKNCKSCPDEDHYNTSDYLNDSRDFYSYRDKCQESSSAYAESTYSSGRGTSSFSPGQDSECSFPEGSYSGSCKHRDTSNLAIIFQIKRIELADGTTLYSMWLSRDPDDPGISGRSFGNLTLASSMSSTMDKSLNFEKSLGEILAERAKLDMNRSGTPDSLSEGEIRDSPSPPAHSQLTEYDRKYETLNSIGKGAFGFVKLARKIRTNTEVVVKFIKKDKVLSESWVDDCDYGRIPLEVSLLTTLEHPNIVKVLNVYHTELFVQMVMEKHGMGMDLFEFIDRQPKLNEALASYIFRQMVSAIAYLHSKGIVHRDVKDENIIVNERFAIKLIDFGAAAFMQPKKLFATFCGTLEYCSPEVLTGHKYKGPELEVWSMGVTLYTLVFGENPFFDLDETIECVMKPPFKVSKSLMYLITWLLHPDPKLRATIKDLKENRWVNQPIDMDDYKWDDVLPNCEFHGNTAADNRPDSVSMLDTPEYSKKFKNHVQQDDSYKLNSSSADVYSLSSKLKENLSIRD